MLKLHFLLLEYFYILFYIAVAFSAYFRVAPQNKPLLMVSSALRGILLNEALGRFLLKSKL